MDGARRLGWSVAVAACAILLLPGIAAASHDPSADAHSDVAITGEIVERNAEDWVVRFTLVNHGPDPADARLEGGGGYFRFSYAKYAYEGIVLSESRPCETRTDTNTRVCAVGDYLAPGQTHVLDLRLKNGEQGVTVTLESRGWYSPNDPNADNNSVTVLPESTSTGLCGRPGPAAGDGKLFQGGPDADLLLGSSLNDDVQGLAGDDSLSGEDGDDCVNGGAGDDRVIGGKGKDGVHGNDGDDWVDGKKGNDSVNGGDGSDVVSGGDGNDLILGGAHNDLLTDGLGTNRFMGQTGNDHIAARQGKAESIDCGPGKDVAEVDTADKVKNCEKVERRTIGSTKAPSASGSLIKSKLPKSRWWRMGDSDYWYGIRSRACASTGGDPMIGGMAVSVHPFINKTGNAFKSAKVDWRLEFWTTGLADGKWVKEDDTVFEGTATSMPRPLWTSRWPVWFTKQGTKYRLRARITWYIDFKKKETSGWTTAAYCTSGGTFGSDAQDPYPWS